MILQSPREFFFVMLFEVLDKKNLHFESILIEYCPEYNTGANTLDTVPCNVSRGCPDVLYHSNEVYKCKIFIITVVYLQYSFAIKNLIWTQLLDPSKEKNVST